MSMIGEIVVNKEIWHMVHNIFATSSRKRKILLIVSIINGSIYRIITFY